MCRGRNKESQKKRDKVTCIKQNKGNHAEKWFSAIVHILPVMT